MLQYPIYIPVKVCIHISKPLATTVVMITATTTTKGKSNTYNLLRAHDTELDFPNLPDRRGRVWERDCHVGRIRLWSSIVRGLSLDILFLY
jgi:hypothetical protein